MKYLQQDVVAALMCVSLEVDVIAREADASIASINKTLSFSLFFLLDFPLLDMNTLS
jgi:hypothetical protein